ncbi:glucose-6-phosphate isomerase [Actinoplanes sp. NPDC049118]|uniref:glucose-6-phosphate isomerase n=1 Tax=Actinoplanes sp. NPDC049118 TaxID=3155769 RepID=UPI0033D33802
MTDDLLAGVEAAAGLAVYGGPATASRRGLVAQGVPGLLASKDPTLWGPAAEAGAKETLDLLDQSRRGRELLPLIAELHEELGDLTNVVLAGPGGTAEVAARTLGRPLTVLDDADPQPVRALIDDPGLLRRTLVVLTDDSLRDVLLQAYLDLGHTPAEAGRHFVALTGQESAGALGITAVAGDPGALTALAFARVDIAELIDEAELFAPSLARDEDNPALALGVALAGADKVALVPDGSGIEGLGEWAADLVTGALGLLAIAVECPANAGTAPEDVLTITYGGSLPPAAVPGGGVRPDVAVNGPLGAQFLAWRYAVAIAGRIRGVDPFRIFEPETAEPAPATPSFVEGAVEIFTTGDATDLESALRDFLADADDHVAVRAFLDRTADAAVAGVRPLLAAACARPVSFGWGQYHRGGPRHGSFLQITGLAAGDVPVPGRPYTLGDRQAARAAGDRRALRRGGRPLLRLHLTDRAEGVRQLLAAAGVLRHRPSPVTLREHKKLAGWARG